MLHTLVCLALAATPTFEDATKGSGLPVDLAGSHRVQIVDLDRDGDNDIVVGVQVFENDGKGRFTEVKDHGIEAWSLFADIDNDGDTDVIQYHGAGAIYLGDGSLRFKKLEGALDQPVPGKRGTAGVVADFDRDGWLDFVSVTIEKGRKLFLNPVYRGTGDGGFAFSQFTSGIPRHSYGVVASDLDRDGDVDLFVSNYRLAPNELGLNRNGLFYDVAHERGVAGGCRIRKGWGGSETGYYCGHSMGSTVTDFNNDGWPDIVVGNLSHQPSIQDTVQFLENMGAQGSPGRFIDVSNDVNLSYQESFAGVLAADVDNDGREDLLVSNAYAGDHTIFLHNTRVGFIDQTQAAIGISERFDNYGIAKGDLDGDGDLDLMLSGGFYRNTTEEAGNWLRLALAGNPEHCNRDAIGTRTWFELPEVGVVARELRLGNNLGNQDELFLHMGAGELEIVELTLRWPCGKLQQLSLRTNQVHVLKEP